jgi:hypothetical protein
VLLAALLNYCDEVAFNADRDLSQAPTPHRAPNGFIIDSDHLTWGDLTANSSK